MIFMPFPRLVGPISAPPPLAIAKVASIKLSSSSSTPLSRSSLATSVRGNVLCFNGGFMGFHVYPRGGCQMDGGVHSH